MSHANNQRKHVAGWLLVGSLFFTFLAIYATNIYQLDFWKTYFYSDTYVPRDKICTASFLESTTKNPTEVDWQASTKKQIGLPHKKADFNISTNPKPFRHIRYLCSVDTANIPKRDGISYFHLGWVFSNYTRIYVEDVLISEFYGFDKVVFALTQQQLNKSQFEFKVEASGEAPFVPGIYGNAPPAFATGNQSNAKVFGLEVALQQIRHLYSAILVLTIGLFLGIGWFFGFRSRLIVAALFFSLAVVARNILPIFSDFWPWDILQTYQLMRAGSMFVFLAMLCFAMEFLDYKSNWVPRIMAGTVVLAFVESVILLNFNFASNLARILEIAHMVSQSVLSIFMIAVALSRYRRSQDDRKPLFLIFLLICIGLAAATAADSFFIEFKIPVRLATKVDIVVPLFVGCLVFYSFMLTEKNYQIEKNHRERMERDLELAREIQDSLSSPPALAEASGWTMRFAQLKHHQVAGDWTAMRLIADHRIIAISIDVTGKGLQASLIVHAIQSLWAESLADDAFEPAAWIRRVNRALCRMGEKKPHTATMGILEINSEGLNYWSFGHTPVFVVVESPEQARPQVRVGMTRSTMLGIHELEKVEPYQLKWEPTLSYSVLIGSDGVVEGGSRTKPAAVILLADNFKSAPEKTLQSCIAEDDRSLMMFSRKAAY